MLLGNLFRDQLDRYGELETIADRWAERRGRRGAPRGARAQRRRPARRRPRPRRAATPLYFGVEDDSLALPELQHASDSKHCRRCGHAYVYEAVYLAHLGRYHCPNCGQRAPRAGGRGHATSSCAASAAPPSRSPRRRARRVELPLPGPLQRLQRARRRRAVPARSASPLDDVVAGLEAVAPAFGRAETLDLGGRPTSILLVKNPAGANEVLRTLALEGRELDLFGVLNDRTADGRDVSWVWDADWEVLAAARAPDDLLGHARRRAGAADEVRRAWTPARLHVVERPRGGPRRGARRRRRPALRRSPPTPRCSSCASCSPAAARRRSTGDDAPAHVVWHDVECGGYDADLPLWRELAREAGGPVLDVGAGTGRVALRARRAPATT